ncbi:hypothetical protein FJZ28_04400 [Candidatus Peregrinibacteria bacterium]|nr:hypothetical protein [Candidatus Peregrinibacteria bacterium]
MESSTQSRHQVLTVIIIIALLALVAALELKRRAVAYQLEQLTVRLEQVQLGDAKQNQEAAKKIITQLGKLIDLPTNIEPTVATIVDVDALRKKNPFYNKAENGDHLVVTTERAILFSSKKNKILDVVPVQLEPVGQQAAQ